MEKYELLNQIGDGTFGSVAKAISKKNGQLVAIKKMKQKFYTWDECVRLPEVDVVKRIHGHPNIVKLREVIRENNELFFVFEFMDGDLLGAIKKAKQRQKPEDASAAPAIPYPTLKSYMQQILQSLAYLHKRGYFHRDLKPENLLVKLEESSGGEIVKLADFGLVKEIRARPPFTDYVSTRWYRAPELLLQDRAYSSPVDIWAAGCIMAELITTRPLFPGSNEVDQLFKIMSTLGSPTERTWPGGIQLGRKIRYTFPSIQGCGLAAVVPKHIPAQALDLISQMLTYDPKMRPSAEQCLQHPFFNVGIDESNGPSAMAMEQLAAASKRLQQQQQQQQPSPQSAPAAFGAGGGHGSGSGGNVTSAVPNSHNYTNSNSGDAGSVEKGGKGKRRSDGSANPSLASAQKYYMLGGNAKIGGDSSAPLGPKAAFSATKGNGPAGSKSDTVPQDSSEAALSPSHSPHGSSSRAFLSPKSTSPLPAPKQSNGLKGLQLANLRSNALKNLRAASQKPDISANGTALTTSTLGGNVNSGMYGLKKPSGLLTSSDAEGGSRKIPLDAAPTSSDSHTAGKNGADARSSSPTALATSSTLASTTAGSRSESKQGGVDIDGLMEEFASEISTLGLNTQKRTAADTISGGDSLQKSSSSASKQDPVAALLSNSRYRHNLPTGVALSSNATMNVTNNFSYPSGSDGNSSSVALAQLQKAQGGEAKWGARNSGAGSPAQTANGQTVTPSIKALLAKHRKGPYQVGNKP